MTEMADIVTSIGSDRIVVDSPLQRFGTEITTSALTRPFTKLSAASLRLCYWYDVAKHLNTRSGFTTTSSFQFISLFSFWSFCNLYYLINLVHQIISKLLFTIWCSNSFLPWNDIRELWNISLIKYEFSCLLSLCYTE